MLMLMLTCEPGLTNHLKLAAVFFWLKETKRVFDVYYNDNHILCKYEISLKLVFKLCRSPHGNFIKITLYYQTEYNL